MKTKILTMAIISLLVLTIGCGKDSVTETPVVNGNTKVTFSGDISSTLEVKTVAVQTNTGLTITLGNTEAKLSIIISSKDGVTPKTGTFKVLEEFEVVVSHNNAFYNMKSGTITIDKLSSTQVSGSFNMSGVVYVYPEDPSRTLNISGKFSGIIVPSE